jgi:outer membrane biosynthesis protein TonB
MLWLVDLAFSAIVGTHGKVFGSALLLLLIALSVGSTAVLALAITAVSWVLFTEHEDQQRQEKAKLEEEQKLQEEQQKQQEEQRREELKQQEEQQRKERKRTEERKRTAERKRAEDQQRAEERKASEEEEKKADEQEAARSDMGGQKKEETQPEQPNFAEGASLYAVLAIDSSATTSEVRTAYYKLARRYHPDKSTAEAKEANSAKFLRISEAYALLSNPAQREKYDREFNSFNFSSFKGFGDFKVDEEQAAQLFKNVSSFFATGKELTAKAKTVQQTVAGRFTDKRTGQLDWMKLATTVGANALSECTQQDGGIDFSKATETLGAIGGAFMQQQEGKPISLADAGNLVLDNLDWLASDNGQAEGKGGDQSMDQSRLDAAKC